MEIATSLRSVAALMMMVMAITGCREEVLDSPGEVVRLVFGTQDSAILELQVTPQPLDSLPLKPPAEIESRETLWIDWPLRHEPWLNWPIEVTNRSDGPVRIHHGPAGCMLHLVMLEPSNPEKPIWTSTSGCADVERTLTVAAGATDTLDVRQLLVKEILGDSVPQGGTCFTLTYG